jgi:hypothetical protein
VRLVFRDEDARRFFLRLWHLTGREHKACRTGPL